MTNEFQLPGNSYNKRNEPEKKAPETERPKLEQITTGNVVRKKKSLRRKFADLFFLGDPKDAMNHVVSDVIVPSIKFAFQDSVNQVFARILGTKEVPMVRPRSTGFMSNDRYRTPYENMSSSARKDDRTMISQRARANHDFDDIIFDTKVEAIEVLERLISLVQDYGAATVSDLYELTGQTEHHTDRKFGWMDLRGSDIIRVRDGYLLDLPKPVALD